MPGPEVRINDSKTIPEATSQEVSVSEPMREEEPEAEQITEAAERLEDILSRLTERIESRSSGAGAASAVFSEKDKDFIKQRILSEVRALS